MNRSARELPPLKTRLDGAPGSLSLKGLSHSNVAQWECWRRARRGAPSPRWERTVCLSELASLGKQGEGPGASRTDTDASVNADRSVPSPFRPKRLGRKLPAAL